MGPIKKYFWKRKYKNKIARCIHSVRLLQTLAKLELFAPSTEDQVRFAMRVSLHETMGDMFRLLSKL